MEQTRMSPVRDTGPTRPGKGASYDDRVSEHQSGQQRRMVSTWERGELEDRYLRLYEDHIYLRKHCNKQEDRLKRLGTKVMQLAVDRKKEIVDGKVKITGGSSIASVKVNDLEIKICELEKQNTHLKEKLKLTKQQLLLASKQPSAYNHVQSRINTGIAKAAVSDHRLVKNRRVMGPQVNGHEQRMRYDTGSATLMENLVMERLQEEIEGLKRQILMYQDEVDRLHEQNKIREADFEESIIKLQQEMGADQRVNVEENIELIRLQRQVKEKSNDLSNLQMKYQKIEESLRTMKHSHESVLMEMDRLNLQLKDEQNKKLSLQQELKVAAAKNAMVIELKEQIAGLQNDKQLLVESNEKLTRSAFDMQREREWRQRESSLKVQIAQLEATLKADLGEKGSVIDRLNTEIAEHEAAEVKLREVRIEFFQMKEQYDDLKNKMSFFTDKSSVDLIELEEALMLVRSKHQEVNKIPDFVQKVDTEIDKATNQRIQQLESEFAETAHELEKTRNMLILQHKINKDYQKEVEDAHRKKENMQRECDLKLNEYASLLDIRAARIKKLESQLRDVAYGTKQVKLNMSIEQDKTIDLDESVQLERGQNLFEIHVHKVNLSSDGLKALGDTDPALFCTWEFYEFEIQATPVVHGATPVFDFTSQYIVTVDDFFLHYIQKETCTLELQHSFGQSFKTLAVCQLRFHDLFDHPPGRIHCTASLTGIDTNSPGTGFGTIEYWINLKVPMEQALRLYKERTKALGYITANNQSTMNALKALDEVAAMRPADNINQLHIKIIHCVGLQARRKDVQPSPYCVYQFFDYGDHDSIILHNTNNPQFNDHHTYPVAMTTALDQYLRSSDLKIFVFDDTDPTESSFLCMANVPLISLVHENDVRGLFELRRTDNTVNGQIEVALYWQDTYLPPLPGPLQVPSHVPTMPTEVTGPSSGSIIEGGQTPNSSSSKTLGRTSSPKPIDTISGTGALTTDFETVSSLSTSKAMSSQISTSTPFPSQPLMSSTPAVNSVAAIVADKKDVQLLGSQQQQQPQPQPQQQPSVLPKQQQPMMSPRAAPRKLKFATETKKPSREAVVDIEPLEKSITELESVSAEQQKVKAEEPQVPQKTKDIIEEEIEESILEETLDESKATSSLLEQQQIVLQPNKVVENDDSDSEGLIIPTGKDSKSSTLKDKDGDTVTVVISHLTLEIDSKPVKNEDVKQLYVEYRFLNYPPEELETPYPLPKPKNGLPVYYHFSKCFHVDYQNNYDKRQFLASMLLPDDPDDGRIRFTVVSEPEKEAQTEECEEVGVAYVSLLDILRKNKDVIDEDIVIYDVDENTVIGSLNVSVICLAALRAVDKEIVRE